MTAPHHIGSRRETGSNGHLGPDQVRSIFELHARGYRHKEIAQLVGVSDTAVYRRLNGRTSHRKQKEQQSGEADAA